MAKTIRQYRYFGENDSRNYPANITKGAITLGNIFRNGSELGSITQLGIQTLPGVKFFLNGSLDPIIVGSTGIYELDLEGISEITELSFDPESIEKIGPVNSANSHIHNGYLIVDAIYNTGV